MLKHCAQMLEYNKSQFLEPLQAPSPQDISSWSLAFKTFEIQLRVLSVL